jgi:hypothetical protein
MKSAGSLVIERGGVTEKQYILGRQKENNSQGLLRVGKYLAIDGSTGSDVYIDCLRPHAVLICGKRGYGKSYTMGILVEELASQKPPVCDNIASVVIDSMGIFWTMAHANKKEADKLSGWGLEPKGLDIRLFVPGRMTEEYADMGVDVTRLTIPVRDMAGSDWCRLFDVNPVHPVGVLITRIVQELKNNSGRISLDDISGHINADIHTDNDTKNAAINFITAAGGWGIFERDGIDVDDIVSPGLTAVIDISSLPDEDVRSMVVGILARRISQERIPARRQHEINRINDTDISTMPMVWMFIDEAHLFVPANGGSLAGDILVDDWLRQGRQPGLSLVLATQRPSALHPDVLSQSDIIMCHRLTSHEDITALEKVRPTYMSQSIAESIRKMGENKGVAFIVDDTSEASHVVKMRPRLTWHGGDEPSSLGHNG